MPRIEGLHVLTIYADHENVIDPLRVEYLLDNARKIGGDTSPLEYVEPIFGGDPMPWGLRVTIVDFEPDPREFPGD